MELHPPRRPMMCHERIVCKQATLSKWLNYQGLKKSLFR
uniref:Uncharacterized protein n=1 Tax=Rhizophora mucronata TaxID=61149 RepID=A0A2P2KCF3_RHIMU